MLVHFFSLLSMTFFYIPPSASSISLPNTVVQGYIVVLKTHHALHSYLLMYKTFQYFNSKLTSNSFLSIFFNIKFVI